MFGRHKEDQPKTYRIYGQCSNCKSFTAAADIPFGTAAEGYPVVCTNCGLTGTVTFGGK